MVYISNLSEFFATYILVTPAERGFDTNKYPKIISNIHFLVELPPYQQYICHWLNCKNLYKHVAHVAWECGCTNSITIFMFWGEL